MRPTDGNLSIGPESVSRLLVFPRPRNAKLRLATRWEMILESPNFMMLFAVDGTGFDAVI